MATKPPQIPAIAGGDVSAILQAMKDNIEINAGQRGGVAGDRAVTAREANVALEIAYLCVIDEKPANTAGGTFTSGAWQTRTLNKITAQAGIGASLASNQILLEAGTYLCRIMCPAFNVDRHKARLRNVTDGTDMLIGTSESSGASASPSQTHSVIVGRLDLSTPKAIEVQHQCQTTAASIGFGAACNFTVNEVYTVAEFWKQRSV